MTNKKTKIVATVGPASEAPETLYTLAQAGVNVFRLNFSHGDHQEQLARIVRIREINAKYGLSLGILQDLQGPKIRIGEVEKKEGVDIIPGNKLIFTNEKIMGNAERVSTPYDGMYNDVKIGDELLLDDGKYKVKVTAIEGHNVVTEVIYGGKLKSKKGVNLPHTKISIPSVTEKDYKDLAFGLEHDVEWVALSFVRTAKEILEVKKFIADRGKSARVVAKIEKPEAVEEANIDEIIAATDAIMVARGDLGVEMAAEDVPMIQKMLVEKCNRAGKPVIVATQMLESMIEAPRPTRAEVNDVANSVLDGADAVMLSGETASGMYPVEAVQAMSATIMKVEEKEREKEWDKSLVYYKYHRAVNDDKNDPNLLSNNVVMSACRLARDTEAKAIIGVTTSGSTGFRLSHHRPAADLYVFTPNKSLMNTLALYWGVKPVYFDKKTANTDELIDAIKETLLEKGALNKGDVFVNTLSIPFGQNKKTNAVKLSVVE